MSELSDYRRAVWDPAERSYKATIASLRARAEAAEANARRLAEALTDAKATLNQIALARRAVGPIATQAQQAAHKIASALTTKEADRV